jgi:hypothetical protein
VDVLLDLAEVGVFIIVAAGSGLAGEGVALVDAGVLVAEEVEVLAHFAALVLQPDVGVVHEQTALRCGCFLGLAGGGLGRTLLHALGFADQLVDAVPHKF